MPSPSSVAIRVSRLPILQTQNHVTRAERAPTKRRRAARPKRTSRAISRRIRSILMRMYIDAYAGKGGRAHNA